MNKFFLFYQHNDGIYREPIQYNAEPYSFEQALRSIKCKESIDTSYEIVYYLQPSENVVEYLENCYSIPESVIVQQLAKEFLESGE